MCSREIITTPTFYDECLKVDFWYSDMMSTNTLPRPASFGTRCKIRKTFWSKTTRNFLQFGFEKMQSFSGALSQLNFWSKKLSPSQMKALAQCSGDLIIHSINNAWNITKWLSEGKIWAHYFIGCWLTRQSINQNWTTSINTIPGQGIDKNIDGAHKFEDIITFCSLPFHVASQPCFVFYDLWKWVNFSLELSHRHFIDETGLFILGDLENIVLTSFATDLAWLQRERWWLGWIIDAKSAPGEFMNQTHRI